MANIEQNIKEAYRRHLLSLRRQGLPAANEQIELLSKNQSVLTVKKIYTVPIVSFLTIDGRVGQMFQLDKFTTAG